MGEYVHPAALRESLQIDGDIDLEFARQQRHLPVGLVAHVDETIERRLQTLAHPVIGVNAK